VRWVVGIAACLFAIGAAGCGQLPVAQQLPTAAAAASPQDPKAVSLTAGDLPDGLTLCPVSGRIDAYLQHLQVDGSPSYEVTASQWAAMKKQGATAGWVQSYARTADDCVARLGERQGPAAISFAIRFKNTTSATAGFDSGFLGLRPEKGMQIPGLAQGTAAQLTNDAWTYDQTDKVPALFVAYWANHEFDLFLLTERLAPDAARRAASGMNERVR
jgi:hypothetical protein